MVPRPSSQPPASAASTAAATAGDGKPAERPTTLLGSIYPWGGKGGSRSRAGSNTGSERSTSAGHLATSAGAAAGVSAASVLRPGSAGPPTSASATPDHSTNSYYGRSFRRYPVGCPPLNIQWFHAVDVPKRKAHWFDNKFNKKAPKETKPPAPPKKFVAFSVDDNRSIESAFQRELEDREDKGVGLADKKKGPGVKVPVNEDFLFDVDIGERELAPVYWLGPVYDVRRGSWFFQEGSTLRPCEENLAAQLEEGYLKAKPWLYVPPSVKVPPTEAAAAAAASATSTSSAAVATAAAAVAASAGDPSPQDEAARSKPAATVTPSAPAFQPETHRLFGHYMNHVATYQDATTAWLSTDGVLSWVTSTMYERFSGGAYMSGVKLVRGYSEPKKAAKEAKEAKDAKDAKDAEDAKDSKRPGTPTLAAASEKRRHMTVAAEAEDKRLKSLKRRSAPPSTGMSLSSPAYESGGSTVGSGVGLPTSEIARRGDQLKQQLSSLIGGGSAAGAAVAAAAGATSSDGRNTTEKEEEEIRKREEKEIQDDYTAPKGETQGREIEHLILVTHGIGQMLGLRMDNLSFIHDVNMLRKTLKSVYAASSDLRALNKEPADGPGNCRIQVLPVCWRHLLDFPRRSDAGKQERDLSDLNEDEEEYPALEDITIEGMAFARSLISDLALDVLLYQSAYREQISDIVLKESNRIHKLFLERNPGFHGTVHIIGHSLGSAILFDILCREKERQPRKPAETLGLRNRLRIWPSSSGSANNAIVIDDDTDDDNGTGSANDFDSDPMEDGVRRPTKKSQRFNFDVEDFYCLGSPIGLFQMIKGRTIAARPQPRGGTRSSSATAAVPVSIRSLADDDRDPAGTYYDFGVDPSATAGGGGGNSGQYLSPVTGLPVSVSSPKVGQLFNVFHPSDPISYRLEPLIAPAMAGLKPQPLPYTKRSLLGALAPQGGFTGIGTKVGQSVSGLWSSFSAGLATNLLNRSLGLSQEDVAKLEQQAAAAAGGGDGAAGDGSEHGHGHGTERPALVDGPEVETLYSHFQKKRAALAKDSKEGGGAGTWKDDEAKAQRMRRDEAKMRALNRNGRVDYSIQESVLDFNPMNTIASHMAYWADEDVSHFIMAQLFAGQAAKKGKDA